jgi:hypothetical protein
MIVFRWASFHLSDRRLLPPDPKSLHPGTPITDGAEVMAPRPEVAVDDGVRREEALRLTG